MSGVVRVKAEELRTLDSEELDTRLKGARRELYELRFKLAVGQLDDHRQIRKVRKDIARILTAVHQRRLGVVAVAVAEPEMAETVEPEAAASGGTPTQTLPPQGEGPSEVVETAVEETPEQVEAPAPKRRRRATSEEAE